MFQEKRTPQTCATEEVHVHLLQQVDDKGVDLGKQSDEERDGEAIGKTLKQRKQLQTAWNGIIIESKSNPCLISTKLWRRVFPTPYLVDVSRI